MRCEDVRKHLADYLTEPADLPTATMEHVTACGACKTEFAELFDLWNEMGQIPAPIPDSAAMRARFTAALETAAQPEQPIPAAKTPWWRVRPWWTMRVAAVAASVMFVAYLAVGTLPHSERLAMTADPKAESELLAVAPSAPEMKQVVGDGAPSYSEAETLSALRFKDGRPLGAASSQGEALSDRNSFAFNRADNFAPGQGGQRGGARGQEGQRAFQQQFLDRTSLAAPGGGGGGGGKGESGMGGNLQNRQQISQTLPMQNGIATLRRDDLAGADRANSRPADRSTGEEYDPVIDNSFIPVSQDPLATFSTDVDTAAYANMRRFLNQNQLPPRNAVRIEEFINYFRYSYPQGSGDSPITAAVEVASAPWAPEHRLVRIGLKAKDVRLDRQPTNLVFLVDVSGSMASNDKLPLLKTGLRMMTSQLTENDKVTIVTYAGSTGIALQATNGLEKSTILQAIENLNAQGSTNGGSGIQLAYAAAVSNFIRGGVNRVILATDGDFNVGITSQDELVRLIEDKAKSGVFLSVLGFGTGNLKDSTMEKLADRGNGHYAYIDSMDEARKVLVDDIAGTLVTVAKDVKIQVEFNPSEANAYRLIGYENRALAAADFANDAKDAGDMGAGHTVTALFEVIPRGVAIRSFDGAPLRFQQAAAETAAVRNSNPAELLNLKIRYKQPDGQTSKLIEFPLVDRKQTFANASADFRFAAAVAAFGMILRDSPHKGTSNWDLVRSIAQGSRNQDRTGARDEFIRLVGQAQQLWRR